MLKNRKIIKIKNNIYYIHVIYSTKLKIRYAISTLQMNNS